MQSSGFFFFFNTGHEWKHRMSDPPKLIDFKFVCSKLKVFVDKTKDVGSEVI